MMRRPPLGLLLLASAATMASADPVYVVETLVVNVTSEPGADGERVATVKSGEKLDLIERDRDQSHVRLANGRDGWIRSSYLTAEIPLQARLNERTAEVEKLKQDVGRLQSELATVRSSGGARGPAVAPAVEAAGTSGGAPAARAANAAEKPTENPPPAQDSGTRAQDSDALLDVSESHQHPLWEWIVGTAGVMLFGGFALGWRTLDRRIRRRYGGLKIY